jgi:hypothetical protein
MQRVAQQRAAQEKARALAEKEGRPLPPPASSAQLPDEPDDDDDDDEDDEDEGDSN